MKLNNIFALALIIPVITCQSSKVVDEKTGRAANAKSDGRTGYYFDDMARYLAGLDLPADSNLVQFTVAPEYAEHRKKMANFWEKVRTYSIGPVSAWRDSTLERNPNGMVCREDRPAFYPLCGADIINLYTVCPRATEYVMVALEKAGDIPHPERQSSQYYKGLRAMRHVINNIADRNYFFSAHMKQDLVKNEEIQGIAPVLLTFAAGLGWHIVDMENVYLAPDGRPVVLDDPSLDFKPKGVRIWFRTDSDPRLRSLTYIEQYLNAASAQATHPLSKFLKQKQGAFMLLKAASYVLHNPIMAAVRDNFISIPDTIVQDDSGFRYLELKPNFEINIYGSFANPVRLKDVKFRYDEQPELAALYRERKPLPLPFNFGYGSLRTPPKSNILVAHRKKA